MRFDFQTFDHAKLTNRETWREFAPKLHIEDRQLFENANLVSVGADSGASFRERIKTEGYIHASGMNWTLDMTAMVEAVRALSEIGLPPVLAFVYDEFWIPFRKLVPVCQALLGNFAMCPDFWLWDVDPKKGELGWPPHREKVSAFTSDGLPKSLTIWIPLTPATPLNSCIYIVPAMLDPTYGTEKESEWQFDLNDIRALPAVPGDFIIWTHSVVHWGSKSSPRASESRVSMAVEFQKADIPAFREPLLDPSRPLPFDARLKMIGRQLDHYQRIHGSSKFVEVGQHIAGTSK